MAHILSCRLSLHLMLLPLTLSCPSLHIHLPDRVAAWPTFHYATRPFTLCCPSLRLFLLAPSSYPACPTNVPPIHIHHIDRVPAWPKYHIAVRPFSPPTDCCPACTCILRCPSPHIHLPASSCPITPTGWQRGAHPALQVQGRPGGDSDRHHHEGGAGGPGLRAQALGNTQGRQGEGGTCCCWLCSGVGPIRAPQSNRQRRAFSNAPLSRSGARQLLSCPLGLVGSSSSASSGCVHGCRCGAHAHPFPASSCCAQHAVTETPLKRATHSTLAM